MALWTFTILRHHAFFFAHRLALSALIEFFQAARAFSSIRCDRAIATTAKKNFRRFEYTRVAALRAHSQFFQRCAAIGAQIGPYRATVRAKGLPSAFLTLFHDHRLGIFLTESDATGAQRLLGIEQSAGRNCLSLCGLFFDSVNHTTTLGTLTRAFVDDLTA